MNISFFNPVNVITGVGCVKQNAKVFEEAGRRCLIVTGKHGARASGALADVSAVLDGAGIAYAVFDGIEPNPSYASCLAAAAEAKRLGA
ncbi:MAG: iron-containing alcohol dehydrogenase, partial [Clostridia bacterium]|nr:iron-containing alcohol dehydrogenase [Clostridia bacterium]